MPTTADEIRNLDRRFLYRLGAAALSGALAAVAVAWVLSPPNAWLVGLQGVLAVASASAAVLDLRLGDRADAAGLALATVGWTVLAAATAAGYPDRLVWIGLACLLADAAVGIAADVRERFGRRSGA